MIHYMCQETLINHLVTKTGISENAIRDFILYGEYLRDEDTAKTLRVTDASGKSHYEFDKNKDLLISEEILSFKKGVNRLKEIDDLLANVKVADLAVGSGAFPLGMLNEIVRARQVLTEYLAIEMNGFQKKTFYAYERKPYDLKINTIKNCIFACDIEPSAVDIAKLRLWLSIVIDDEIADDTGNGEFDAHTRPRQLPNLDCNIICGNSLIDEFRGNKLIKESELLHNVSVNSQITMYQGGIDSLLKELISLQDKLFFIKEHEEKEEVKRSIQYIYNQIILEQINGNPELVEDYYDAISKSSKPFIIWQLYFSKVFRDNGGFDIVIGNPPYIGQSGNKDIFREVKETSFGKKYHQRRMDFHYFFYHKGLDLLSSNGHLMLITTNYFLDATNADKLRLDMKERSRIKSVINFNELKIFESATGQHNLIMLLQKSQDEQAFVRTAMVNRTGFANSSILNDIFNHKDVYTEYNEFPSVELFNEQNGQINIKNVLDESESVLNKMAKAGNTLGELSIINQGIVTGCNKISKKHLEQYESSSWHYNQGIFVLSEDEVNQLDLNEEEKGIIKPWFKNSDIHKWFTEEETSERLIYYATKHDYCDVEHIKKYLAQFKSILINRNVRTGSVNEEQYDAFIKGEYDIPYVMIASEMKRGNYYCVSYAREEFIFESPKIVVPQRSKTNTFGYTESVWYGATDVYFINKKGNGPNLKYLLALLNSKLYYFWLYHRGKRKGKTLELFLKPLSDIPILMGNNETTEKVISISNEIYEKRKLGENSTECEERLNEIIYSMFELSESEIAIVEQTYSE